jgi:predicted nucleic acid-binding protein
MSEPAFLDTGAIYALADRNDLDHESVRAVYADLEWKFVTHELVLVEAFSLLTKRLHKRAALQTIEALRRSPRIEIEPVGARLLEAGWARCARFRDKEWDWIDCTSFEVMEERRLRHALSLDHHFTQAGFLLLGAARA